MIKRIKLPGIVWRIVHDSKDHQLYLDLRLEGQDQETGKIDLNDLSLTVKNHKYPPKSELVGASGNDLYFVQYDDPDDPNEQRLFTVSWEDGSISEDEQGFDEEDSLILPQIYLQGTDHHATVAKYLNSELPLSCEYLEWNGHIIISYYSRFENRYRRHLLIIKDGIKKGELLQDQQVRGFSPGAFFAVEDQLIFIKDRNEVCIYTD